MNKSQSATQCGHWNLYKLDGSRWFHIGPYVHTADCRILHPGQTKSWTLNASDGKSLSPVGNGRRASFGFLGAGAYAVVVGYGDRTDQSAALVELTGDDVSIEPTDDVTADRSAPTVTVTAQRDERTGNSSPATVTLETSERVAEQVVDTDTGRKRFRIQRYGTYEATLESGTASD